MRVLTVIYNLGLGGTQRAAKNFSVYYKRAGCQVAVLALDEGGPREQELEVEGIPVFIGTGTETITQSQKWRPDLIHVHRWGEPDARTAAILRALKSDSCKVIETNVFSWVDGSAERDVIDLHLHLSRWCLWKWARGVRDLRLDPEPLACVMPYLVDASRFFPSEMEDVRAFREAYGIPADAFVFGRIGQSILGKWSLDLIPVIQEVLKAEPDAHFLLVGVPEEIESAIRALPEPILSRVNRIPFIKGDDALRICYGAMDVFVHSARIGESFGMVLAEAMLCGVPVVTVSTPRGDNSQVEVVGHELGGLVVSRASLLGKALIRLKRDPVLLNRLSATAQQRIRSRYEGSVVIDNLLGILKEILPAGDREGIQAALNRVGATTQVSEREIARLLWNTLGAPGWKELLFVFFPRFFELIRRSAAVMGGPRHS